MMTESTSAKQIEMVFDVYRNNSIYNIELLENRSATTALRFNQILPTHKVHQSWEFQKGPGKY